MQLLLRLFLISAVLLSCAACDTSGSIKGGGSDNGSYGRVKVGMPF